ncbi:hypothetical protein MJ579_04785 [Klebsiella pneumoniae]|nr:hypothetical protein MJ579_04785 [Klebsiella pneumoniae]
MGGRSSTTSSIRLSPTSPNKNNMTLDQMRSRLAYEGINYIINLPQPDP